MLFGKPSQIPAHATGKFLPPFGFNPHRTRQKAAARNRAFHFPNSRLSIFQTTAAGTNFRRINTCAKPHPQLSQNQHFQFIGLKAAQNQHLRKWREGEVCCCVAPWSNSSLLDGPLKLSYGRPQKSGSAPA